MRFEDMTPYQQDLELWRGYLRSGDEKYLEHISLENLDIFVNSLNGAVKKSL